jgi:signal transduction histidine kinase
VKPATRRKRSLGQILLWTAGFLVLVAISASSVLYVNRAGDDNASVVRTIEVENRISALLLDVRRAESSARGYLLTRERDFLADHEQAVAAIMPGLDQLGRLTANNPSQLDNNGKLRSALEALLDQFSREIRFVKQGNKGLPTNIVRETGLATTAIRELADAMRSEEDRLFALRASNAHRSQLLASTVTIAGSGLVILLAAISIVLVRRSARARDDAEAQLRENTLNLEATVDARTADLREANDEIQRFANIVSHDLRSPLVNIMGFTSELEQMHADIFRRIASLSRGSAEPEPQLDGPDKQLSHDFSEALDFIKSSISKMDRLINAILKLTREGWREFKPEQIDTTELIEGIVKTLAHQAAAARAEIRVAPLPGIVSDRLALEQIFSNLIDNSVKYLRPGVPGEITVHGRTKLGFSIFEVADNGRGIDPKDYQRIFDLFRRAGIQNRPGEGIGLAYVRALVRRLGGTMSVASELNSGSTFTVTLPIQWTIANGKAAS